MSRPGQELLDPAVIRELAKEPGFDRSALLSGIVQAFGGTGQLAEAIHDDYLASPVGSTARQRFLDMICRLINYETQAAGDARDPSEMSDEELADAMKTLLAAIKPKATTDGPQEAPAPTAAQA
jgi:hypothetical protein